MIARHAPFAHTGFANLQELRWMSSNPLLRAALALSHDGSLLARPFYQSEELAELWSTREMKLVGSVGERGTEGWGVNGLALSGDGALLAIAYLGQAQIWNTNDLKLLRVVKAPEVFGNCSYCGIRAVSLSPDGSLLAASMNRQGDGYGLRVWDVELGTILYEYDYSLPNFRRPPLAFSSDGTRIVATAERREAPRTT